MVLGVETALWSTAAKRAGKCYRGVLETAERFMVKWHEDEAQLSSQRRAFSVGGAQGNGGTGGNRRRRSGRKPDLGNGSRGGNRRSTREIAVDESRKETTDRVARHQAEYCSEWNMSMLLLPPIAAAGSTSSSFLFSYFCALILRDFFIVTVLYLPSFPCERIFVA